MDCTLVSAAAALFLGGSACGTADIPPPGPPTTAEISRTYRLEIYDLFRCMVAASPELRRPARGWSMNYSDAYAVIDAGPTEISFRPVSPGETQILVRTVGNPYKAFFPGRWVAIADRCWTAREAGREAGRWPEAIERSPAARPIPPLRMRM